MRHMVTSERRRKKRTHSAYSSRSCSPESPIKMNFEQGSESKTSATPARLRAAGFESSPLRRDLPAYDLSLIEPNKN